MLIELKSRLAALENEQISTDNHGLKKRIEVIQEEISKDKKELVIKLKSQNDEWTKQQNAAEKVLESLYKKMEELEKLENKITKDTVDAESNLARRRTQFEERFDNLDKAKKMKENKLDLYDSQVDRFVNEKRMIEEAEQEIVDAREKMIKQRQEVINKNRELREKEQSLELQMMGLERRLIAIAQDRASYERQLADEENALLSTEKGLELVKQTAEDDKKKLEFEKKDYQRQFDELQEEKKQLKVEAIRVWREKANIQERIRSFMELKKSIEEANLKA